MRPIAEPLLQWYHQNRRVLPFREDPTPYKVWVSEIMLQQTRVSAALPYFERFMAALPGIEDLAACTEDELHKLWQGLGYYNRAKNLQKAAQVVVSQYGGQLPADYQLLLQLPGIGPYTAGAIASIAFGLPQVAVDGNVLRVFSRLLASRADIGLPQTKKWMEGEVQAQQPKDQPGDFNQALMELGALVCVPGVPGCGRCPLAIICEGYRQGIAETLPVVPAKKAKTEHPICVLVLHDSTGRVLLHKRPAKGLLAGLYEPVLLEGRFTQKQAQEQLAHLAKGARLTTPLPTAKHVFTHRIWKLYGWLGHLPDDFVLPGDDYQLASPLQLREEYAVPGAFKAYLPFMQGPKA